MLRYLCGSALAFLHVTDVRSTLATGLRFDGIKLVLRKLAMVEYSPEWYSA